MLPSSQSSPHSGSKKEPSTHEINALLALFKIGDYAGTETLARELTARYSHHVFGWKAMGTALLLQGRAAEALPPLQKAVELSPGDAQLHNNLGNSLASLDRLDDAEQCYRQTLKLRPDFSEAHQNLGNTLIKLGRHAEAAECYRHALTLKPDLAEVHNMLGSALRKLGKSAEAEDSFRRAIQIKPDLAKAHRNLGLICNEQERLDEAEACYREALAIDADFVEAHYNLGNNLKKQGKPDAAAACFRSCLKIDPEDHFGARLLLTALGFEPMPLRASGAQLEDFYDMKAAVWDRNLVGAQTYYGAKLVAEALARHVPKSGILTILDAGCGTGQVGLLIRDLAGRLDGVDMSASMLDKARKKQIYDNIFLSDLESLMVGSPGQYEAITCAATLIHFGDLASVFKAAATCLTDQGLFVFTVFKNDNEPGGPDVIVSVLDGLAKSGCYAHRSDYVIRIAESTGFAVESVNTEIHEYRQDNGLPIMCLVVVLRRCIEPL